MPTTKWRWDEVDCGRSAAPTPAHKASNNTRARISDKGVKSRDCRSGSELQIGQTNGCFHRRYPGDCGGGPTIDRESPAFFRPATGVSPLRDGTWIFHRRSERKVDFPVGQGSHWPGPKQCARARCSLQGCDAQDRVARTPGRTRAEPADVAHTGWSGTCP